MISFPKMISMEQLPEDREETSTVTAISKLPRPQYPWGLKISLCRDELKKLGVNAADLSIGETVHVVALGVVTSVSQDVGGGIIGTDDEPESRVEVQLTDLALESEDAEASEEEEQPRRRLRSVYKN